jgi:hypothetical protein
MGQFKGLTQSSTEDKYVRVICKGVQPLYAATYPRNLDSGLLNGWMVTCYTGISSCETASNNMTLTILDNVTATESSTCMNDPRYLTWRALTMRLKIDGTQSWYRLDSYWNSSKLQYSSTWGTGLVMSTEIFQSSADNNGSTNLGKTFVFAYGDGSGIQFNHITFADTPPTSNSTAGSGNNQLSTAPTSYTNTSPNRLNENMCLSADLKLEGTTDTSALASVITAFSDGYKGILTLDLEMMLTGAAGGWRGVCMVYYSSQYVQDNSNGALCFAAQQSTAEGAGPLDFGAGYLMHVAPSSWQPPAKSASLQPSSAALTGTKYKVVYSPSAVTSNIFTAGFYASVTWY